MIGTEEDILLLDLNPENILVQEDNVEGQTIIQLDMTTDSQDLEVHPDPLSGNPELHLGHPVGTVINALAEDSLAISLENVLRRTLL